VVLAGYSGYMSDQYTGFYGYSDWPHLDVRTANWAHDSGGNETSSGYTPNDVGTAENYFNFTDDLPTAGPGSDGPGFRWDYFSVNTSYLADDGAPIYFQRSSKAIMMIVPAGQEPAGTTNVYLVLVGGMEYSDPVQDVGSGPGDVPHPPEWTKINGQTLVNTGITNEDGSMMGAMVASAVGGTTVTLTPTITQFYNNDAVSFNGHQVTNLTLQIFDANTGANLSAQTNTVIVGQQMNWYCHLSVTNQFMTNFPLVNYQWTIQGYAISNYVANDSSGIVYTNFPTTHSNVVFYWVDGASNRVIQCSAMVNGKPITAQATFNVLRPTGQIAAFTGTVAVDANYFSGFALHYGNAVLTPGVAGILFSNQFVMPSGNNYNYGNTNYTVEWIQEVNSSLRQFQTNTTGGDWYERQCALLTNSVLDTSAPYPQWTADNSATIDAPAEGFDNSTNSVWKTVSTSDNFTMWLMFKPAGGQLVPLGSMSWNWAGTATLNSVSTNGSYWSLTGASNNSPTNSNSTTYPQWTDNIVNHTTIIPKP